MSDKEPRWWEKDELLFAVGVEDTFISQTREGERSLDEYALTQHYDQWESDIDLIVETGASMVRWGIPWHRVNPSRGVWDWEWLDKVAEKFASTSVRPIIDLMHYGTPLWLEGEFFNDEYPALVAEYAREVAQRYGHTWQIYTPMNEPMLTALYCGLYSYWPPYGKSDWDFVRILRALQRGIVATQNAISTELGTRATFVHVEAAFRFVAAEPPAETEVAFLRHRSFILEDLLTGSITELHPMHPYLKAHGFTEEDFRWSQTNTALPDVMGVNYYPAGQTELVSVQEIHSGGPGDFRPRINAWTEGLEDVLRTFESRYHVPVFLTETSHIGDAKEKSDWLTASVQTVRDLRDSGLRVVGYTWWSIIDMIEWTYRHGDLPPDRYQLAMGLWALETDQNGVMQRVRTPLVDLYRQEALSPLNSISAIGGI